MQCVHIQSRPGENTSDPPYTQTHTHTHMRAHMCRDTGVHTHDLKGIRRAASTVTITVHNLVDPFHCSVQPSLQLGFNHFHISPSSELLLQRPSPILIIMATDMVHSSSSRKKKSIICDHKGLLTSRVTKELEINDHLQFGEKTPAPTWSRCSVSKYVWGIPSINTKVGQDAHFFLQAELNISQVLLMKRCLLPVSVQRCGLHSNYDW